MQRLLQIAARCNNTGKFSANIRWFDYSFIMPHRYQHALFNISDGEYDWFEVCIELRRCKGRINSLLWYHIEKWVWQKQTFARAPNTRTGQRDAMRTTHVTTQQTMSLVYLQYWTTAITKIYFVYLLISQWNEMREAHDWELTLLCWNGNTTALAWLTPMRNCNIVVTEGNIRDCKGDQEILQTKALI